MAASCGGKLWQQAGAGMDGIQSIEEKLAHLMRAVDDLSEVVARQSGEIDMLTRRVQMLLERAAEDEAGMAEAPAANVRPPHW